MGGSRGEAIFKKQDRQETKAKCIYSSVPLSLTELFWNSVQTDTNVQCLNPCSMDSISILGKLQAGWEEMLTFVNCLRPQEFKVSLSVVIPMCKNIWISVFGPVCIHVILKVIMIVGPSDRSVRRCSWPWTSYHLMEKPVSIKYNEFLIVLCLCL